MNARLHTPLGGHLSQRHSELLGQTVPGEGELFELRAPLEGAQAGMLNFEAHHLHMTDTFRGLIINTAKPMVYHMPEVCNFRILPTHSGVQVIYIMR